jgi:hypothetical protein
MLVFFVLNEECIFIAKNNQNSAISSKKERENFLSFLSKKVVSQIEEKINFEISCLLHFSVSPQLGNNVLKAKRREIFSSFLGKIANSENDTLSSI